MDYEKKYKEAQGWIEKIYPTLQHEQQMEAEAFFPELAESKDERIRKAIINVFSTHKDYEMFFGASVEDIRTWLEKQGEQKASYTTIVETGNGGINALVTRELSNSCDYEEKPADKVEPFDKYEGLTDFERTLADTCIGWIGEELGWKQYIKDNADVLLKIAVEKFNSVQDVPFEQKPAWSEEDEVKINRIVACLENLNVADNDILLKDVDWLKSLKDRVQPQPNQEWSEEDEKIAKTIINEFEQSSEWYCANGLTKEDSAILGMFSVKKNKTAIEYTRTDAFIEKACDWLINHNDYICGSTNGIVKYDMGKLVDDFKKYMEE